MGHRWTPDEDQTLTEMWAKPSQSVKQIAQHFEVPEHRVRNRARLLGLTSKQKSPWAQPGKERAPWRRWTPNDVATLKLLWGERTAQTIARRLGRTMAAVRGKAEELRLDVKRSGIKTSFQIERETGYDRKRLERVAKLLGIKKIPIPWARKAYRRNVKRRHGTNMGWDFDDANKILDWLKAWPDGRRISLPKGTEERLAA